MKVPFFGVDHASGKPAFAPMSDDEVAQIAPHARPDKPADDPARIDADGLGALGALEAREQKKKNADDALGPTADVQDLNDLGQAGWAVVWGPNVTPEIKEALEPLINWRQQMIDATKSPKNKRKLFRELELKHNDTLVRLQTTERWNFGPSPVDPGIVPAYLMLVGSPSDISFDLQHELDVDFFVGRLDLDDAAAYEAYARAVVAAENDPKRPRNALFWGTEHDGTVADEATKSSMPKLITPLATEIEELDKVTVARAFQDKATKAALSAAMGAEVPGLLFTAGHGDAWSSFDTPEKKAAQRAGQGALITKEWVKDPNHFGPLDESARFAASDVKGSLDGLIAIFFACYGGGTPKRSRFPYSTDRAIRTLAPESFTAQLPKTMLARGAGAVLAHVERTWDTGFTWAGVKDPQIGSWRSVILSLLQGSRVGRAGAFLNERYSSIGAQLNQALFDENNNGIIVPEARRAYLWMQQQDARSWMVLGDPAAKLALKA